MILVGAVGYLLQRFAGLHDGVMYGLLAGFLVAPLVPSPTSCPLPSHRTSPGPGGPGSASEGEVESADPDR